MILHYLKQFGFLLLDLLAFIGIAAILMGFFTYLISIFLPETLLEDIDNINPYHGLLQYASFCISVIVAMIISHVYIFKRDYSLLGFNPKGMGREFGHGWLLATIMISVGFLLLYALGWMKIDKIDFQFSLFVGFLLFFLVQSAFEELLGRSYLIPAISSRFNTGIALIASSLVFSLLHGSNDSVTAISLIEIFLAGLLMGLLFLKFGKIWAAIGVHAGWNFLQGSFFGFEVSGIDVYSLIDSSETGPDLMTGGPFGFEGSLLSIIFTIAACLYVYRSMPPGTISFALRGPEAEIQNA